MVCENFEVLEVTDEEFLAFASGQGIMKSFPTRDANFRELIKTGTHPDCWDKIFSEDE